jgi:Uri superfamily endonuclease
MRSTPGAYVLIVSLSAPVTVDAGLCGRISLGLGHYLYCGSAQGGLGPRLARHMRKDKEKHWHVDALTAVGDTVGALTFPGEKDMECRLAQVLSGTPGVVGVGQGFGSSDCRCPTHLFHVPEEVPLQLVMDVLRATFSV